MTNNQNVFTTKHTANNWKILAIILIALVSILGGLSTFLLVENNKKAADNLSMQEKLDACQATQNHISDKLNALFKISESYSNKRYMTISEWGIKMEIPYGVEKMTYRLQQGVDDTMMISGILANAFPSEDNVDPRYLEDDVVTVQRTTVQPPTPDPSKFVPFSGNNLKFEDYYYSYTLKPYVTPVNLYISPGFSKMYALRVLLWNGAHTMIGLTQ